MSGGRAAFGPEHEVVFHELSDKTRVRVLKGGRPGGQPVLFCYGLGCSSHHFKYQWAHLSREHRLLLVDYRGHHEVRPLDPGDMAGVTFSRLADDLAEVLALEKVNGPVAVVGHSMGVNVSLEFFERHPGRVGGLVLIAGAPRFPARDLAEARRISLVNSLGKLLDGIFPSAVETAWKLPGLAPGIERVAGLFGFNPRLTKPEDIRACVDALFGRAPRVFFHMMGEYLKHDKESALDAISVPTLIISGEEDKMVSSSFSEMMHRRIRGSQHVRIAQGSHCPQFDRPDEVNRELERFLKRLGKKTGARSGEPDGARVVPLFKNSRASGA